MLQNAMPPLVQLPGLGMVGAMRPVTLNPAVSIRVPMASTIAPKSVYNLPTKVVAMKTCLKTTNVTKSETPSNVDMIKEDEDIAQSTASKLFWVTGRVTQSVTRNSAIMIKMIEAGVPRTASKQC